MTHAIKAGLTDQIAYFRAYDTDGTAKVNLTSATTGLTLSVFRVGASAVSISSLSDKAADNTAHADGAIRQVQGNLYTVDLPDAAVASQVPSICVKGTYTGGVIEGVPHPIVGYDGTAARVGASDGTGVTLAADQAVNVTKWDGTAVGSVTINCNMTQISGDATAADNLEAALDGTGGVTLSVVLGTDAITAASLADSAGAELAALVETYIVNEGDATAVMQAIADKIAADWVAGDASPLAIVAAIKADATIATMISRVDATVSSRSSHSAADVLTALGTGIWATAIPWNAAWDAEVQSEVQDAIEANNLDHLVKIAVDTDFGTTVHLNSVIGHLADNGTSATFSRTTDSLEAIRDRGDAAWTTGSGGGGGSGTGARTVTITVNDGTTALQNATVRLTEGANTFTAQTNVSGVATFNVDDATYVVSITKAGYSYSGTTLVVDGDESTTYSMTAITITPSTGDQTTGYLTTLDETGAAEAGVSIYVSLSDVPDDYGLALDEATRTMTSDEDGLVEITGMVKGATYNLRRGLKGRLFTVTIPTTAGSTYELPNMAGV